MVSQFVSQFLLLRQVQRKATESPDRNVSYIVFHYTVTAVSCINPTKRKPTNISHYEEAEIYDNTHQYYVICIHNIPNVIRELKKTTLNQHDI